MRSTLTALRSVRPTVPSQAHPGLHHFVLAHGVRAEAHKGGGVAHQLCGGKRVTSTGHLVTPVAIGERIAC